MINYKISNKEEPFHDINIDDYGNINYFDEKGKLFRLMVNG